MRPKSSILHDRSKMLEVTSKCNSIKECLETLGLRAAGGNYKQFHLACESLNIIPPRGIGFLQTKKAREVNTIPLDQVLVQNSTYTSRATIKRRLFSANLLKNECYSCGIGPFWNNKPISLQLDHINGIYNR